MKVVILAGGLGSRLKPFTDVIPKPLLPVGEKSLLELQFDLLKSHGFTEVFLALGHKSEYVESFLGDGDRYGIKIHYSIEEMRLGTAGPLSLLRDELHEPFLVMNGDILTKANFSEIMETANRYADSPLTVVTKFITTPFRFGNIITDGVYIKEVEEKPDLKFEIVAGMYVMKPEIFEYIPNNEYFGMDQLIRDLLEAKAPVTRHLLKEYWVDIGVVEDYEQARQIYEEHFKDSGEN